MANRTRRNHSGSFKAPMALALARYADDRLFIEAMKEAINSVAMTFKPQPIIGEQ
jgi:hypothetical protein